MIDIIKAFQDGNFEAIVMLGVLFLVFIFAGVLTVILRGQPR